MSDAPSAPPREGVTVTPPRATRIPPLDPETPESQAPNPHHASNNAGPGQQPQRTGGFGATGAASSEATPPKREDEEDAEQHDVNRTHVSSDTPAADVAAVARLAREDDRARADADEQRDEPAEDVPMAESGDEALGREADLADEHAHDESAEDTDADERDDVDETEDEDMADPGPERWSFLDLRGGHHALDVYHEVRLVVSRFASFSRASAPNDIGFRPTRAKHETVQNLTKPFPEYSASRDGPTERRPGRLLLRRHDRRAGLARARHPGHSLGPPAVHARAVPREAGLRVQELRQPRDRRRAPGRGVHARARGW